MVLQLRHDFGRPFSRSVAREWVVALALKLLCRDARVVAAEAKGIAYYGGHFRLARRVLDIIQVTLRVGYLVVDRRREHVRFERFGADGHLHGSSSSEHVAGG